MHNVEADITHFGHHTDDALNALYVFSQISCYKV